MLGLLLAGCVLLGFPCSIAIASTPLSLADSQVPTKKPKPTPPPVVVVGTKEGAKASANSKADGRLVEAGKKDTPRPRPKPGSKPKQPVSATTPEQNPRLPKQQATPQEDFRINIGICGHVGDSPGLTRCLPALEDDRPDQPNLPETTPSMAVAIRIPRPEDVGWEQILSEYRDVLFPKLGVKVQPSGRTLVNLDTIVYTDQSKISVHTVTLLGFPVVVEAMPMSYTWNFGDGASMTTTTPGRPYPAKDITHKYMKKGGVGLTLTTNYAARFNVAGTGWQYVERLVPITGPATALQVREAVPVLVEPER